MVLKCVQSSDSSNNQNSPIGNSYKEQNRWSKEKSSKLKEIGNKNDMKSFCDGDGLTLWATQTNTICKQPQQLIKK